MGRIEDYTFGRIVVDGEEHRRDLIILPNRVRGHWWRRDGHRLVLNDLEDVLDELPECLVIGTGAAGQMRPDPAAIEALSERGVDVKVAPTPDAVRMFGESNPAKTAAALHLTC